MSNDNIIKVLASDKLKEYLTECLLGENDAPENLRALVNEDESLRKRGGKSTLSTTAEKIASPFSLNLQDLSWLKSHLREVAKDDGSHVTPLHKLLEGCTIILPEPPVTERNPELEARVQKLKKEQAERDYRAMTKNVDSVRVHHPDDSISSQMKMINSHMIAVFQFVVSVGAGFTFGFLGIELMVGSLDFGFRLLLGVACALTIALAEIYFLAKKLSEEFDDAPGFPTQSSHKVTTTVTNSIKKQHND